MAMHDVKVASFHLIRLKRGLQERTPGGDKMVCCTLLLRSFQSAVHKSTDAHKYCMARAGTYVSTSSTKPGNENI